MESKRSFSFVSGCLVSLVIGCCCVSVGASPFGAPEEACEKMTPGHGVGWQNTTCPFEIIVEQTTIYMDESLNITLGIKGEANDTYSEGFKGFMIMAFDATGQNIDPIGIFDEMDFNNETQTMDCPIPSLGPNYTAPQIGVTHTNNDFKKSIQVVWTPPAEFLGPIIIAVTFVHERTVFWVKETSTPVQIILQPGVTPPVRTTTKATTMSTTSASTTTASTTTASATSPTTTTPKPTTQGAASAVTQWTVLFGVALLSFLV